MGFCGSCQTAPHGRKLFQIKRLSCPLEWIDFSVEADSDQWTLRVRDSKSSETLYMAHRGGVRAAQSAANDFASFRFTCDSSSPELKWQAYW